MSAPPRRRIVVTGLGCVSPIGGDVASSWAAAVAGRSGIGPITRFDPAAFPARIAGEVKGEPDLGDLPAKEARRFDRVISLGLAAANEAVRHAGLEPSGLDPDRIGVSIGSGIGGIQVLQDAHRTLVASGPRRVSPFLIPMTICNMAAGVVAIQHGLRGPNMTLVSACASGAQSIGEAARVIERGDADVMLAGGSEAAVVEIALAGFANMKALSLNNDAPEQACRPFDRDRDGFVVGEGAAVLVLESEEHARGRGAAVLARLLGYATTSDATHIATPREDAASAIRCMRLALADADLAPRDVGYLNAHATSTPAGDPVEAKAIRTVFGSDAHGLAVSSTKSMTGHLLGAAGALEALFCVRALETGVLPPTTNLDQPDPECELDHVANTARPAAVRAVASNSFGFGGTNSTLVLGRADA